MKVESGKLKTGGSVDSGQLKVDKTINSGKLTIDSEENNSQLSTLHSQLKNVPKLRFKEFSGEWVRKNIEDVANVIDPHPSHRAPAIDQDGIPFIGIGDIFENGDVDYKNVRLVSKDIYKEHRQRYQLNIGDFAFGRVASIGKVVDLSNNTDKEYTYSPTMAIIQPHSIDSKYLQKYSNSDYFMKLVSDKTTGSTRKSIGMQNLRVLNISIPTKPEQQKIASFLTSVDKKIELLTQKEKLLKDYKKGIMQKIFSQEIRFKASDGSKFPEWVETTVGTHFEVGSSKRVLQQDWTTEGVPFYRTRELVSLAKNESFSSEIFISQELFSELVNKYGIPKDGDYLVSGVGTLGIYYQVKPTDKFYFKDGNVLWFKRKPTIVSDFFRYCFESDYVQNQIVAQASTTTVGTYTIQNAKKTKLFVPSNLEEQTKVANFLSAIDSKIEQVTKQLDHTKEFKKGLLQQMFV